MNVLAKDLSDLHAMQVVFFRMIGTFVFIFPFMLYKKISIIGNNPKILAIRSLVGFISIFTFFLAIQRTPLGPAISIRYLGPIFGSYFAYLFLKEKVSFAQGLSFAIAFSGVIILKGFDLRIDNWSLVLLLISAILVGIVFVLVRYLTSKEHPLTIINYFIMISVIISSFSYPLWTWPAPEQYFSAMAIGIFGLLGQVFMTYAFKLEETSIVAPFKYMELVWVLIMSYFFFGEKHSIGAFWGMVLIVTGMLLNVYFKSKQSIKE